MDFAGKMLHLHTAQASDLTQQLSSAAQAQSKRLTKIKNAILPASAASKDRGTSIK